MKRLYKPLLVFCLVGGAAIAIFVASHYLRGDTAEATVTSARAPLPETHDSIEMLKKRIETEANLTEVYVRLGFAQMQASRETAEGTYVDRAEESFGKALEIDSRSALAMQGLGMVAMTRHQFTEAVEWGKKSVEANPYNPSAYGVLVDAYTDLGQYDMAVQMAQQMVDMRPDLASYSRIAYLRALHGEMEGAIEAAGRAVAAASGSIEQTNWVRVQLGSLYYQTGQMDLAERTYRIALSQLPMYGHALAGMAQLHIARGEYAEAVDAYEDAVHVRPIGGNYVALGGAYELAGMQEKADEAYDRAIEILEEEEAGGMNMHEELALLLLDLDIRLEEALELAKIAYERRPTVKNADILGWAYFKNGEPDKALYYAEEALRIDSHEARYYYHAGRIAAEAGEQRKAESYLAQALEINPHFSVEGAAWAGDWLARHEGS